MYAGSIVETGRDPPCSGVPDIHTPGRCSRPFPAWMVIAHTCA